MDDHLVVTARRRDRRGRGIRGNLLPPTVPAHRTRSDLFDALVVESLADIEGRWGDQLAGVEVGVELIPPTDPAPWESTGVPLGRCFPASGGQPARIILYRRPIEQRASSELERAELVYGVLVEQVAHLLGRDVEDIDPSHWA